MALRPTRAAFFDVDNTLVRGSTLYFLGRGMYQRGYFTKADISRFVVANLRFRMTGTEKQDVINRFQKLQQILLVAIKSATFWRSVKKFMMSMYRQNYGSAPARLHANI